MKNQTYQLTTGGLLVALGVLIPSIFHLTGISGPMFLPMHIPVLLAGFYLSPLYAVIVGVLTPIISSLLIGMPPLYPIGLIMIFELATYALVASMLYSEKNLWVTLTGAMLTGRVVAGLVVSILQLGFGLKMNPVLFIKGAIITGIPGIVIQLLLIPIIVLRFKKPKNL